MKPDRQEIEEALASLPPEFRAAVVLSDIEGLSLPEVAAALDQLTAWLSGDRDEPPLWAGYEALAPALPRTGRHGAILLPLRALLGALDSAV